MIAEGRVVNPISIKPCQPEQIVGDITFFAHVVKLATEAVTVSGAYDCGRGIIEMWARHRRIGAAQDPEMLARNMRVDRTPGGSFRRWRSARAGVLRAIQAHWHGRT